jgi:hypothetical protein
MSISNLFRNSGKVPATAVFLLIAVSWLGLFVWGIWGIVQGMSRAASEEEYSYLLSNLVSTVGMLVFSLLYLIMGHLIYIKKQYSKWCMWLFYVWGVASLAYFIVSGMVYDYMFDYANQENIFKMAAHARRVLTGPLLFVMICFMFIPKLIKDAMKLKEEQDLTI